MKILEHELLEFHPDTLLRVRESCGLGTPGRMKEAVDILQDWAARQEHFLKKDFHPIYLENLVVACKGSLEKAKRRLDLLCTMRTFVPELFVKINVKKDLPHVFKACKGLVAPKMSEDLYRLSIMKMSSSYQASFLDLFQYVVILNEYLKLHDYSKGHICVADLRDANIFDLATKLNPVELRNIITLVMKGYGVRLKSFHFLTPSKSIGVLVSLFKQVFSQKITSRINVHKTVEELHQHVPKSLLPADLGGEERTLDTLQDAWLEILSSEDHVRHMREMQEARTDESRRREERNDAMFGLPGTFRRLDVD